jgi:hypothetical protein
MAAFALRSRLKYPRFRDKRAKTELGRSPQLVGFLKVPAGPKTRGHDSVRDPESVSDVQFARRVKQSAYTEFERTSKYASDVWIAGKPEEATGAKLVGSSNDLASLALGTGLEQVTSNHISGPRRKRP